MFKKLFGEKTETKNLVDSNKSDNSVKKFSVELKEEIEQSRLQFRNAWRWY